MVRIVLTRLFFWICILLCMNSTATGQSQRDTLFEEGICDNNGFCIPQIPGLPRSKGLIIRYEQSNNQIIKSEFSDSSHSGSIDESNLLMMKLRIPILLKDNLKILIGAEYKEEKYQFDEASLLGSAAYLSLNQKPLKMLSTSAYVVKPFRGNSYALGRVKVKLSGDFTRNELDDYFRSSLSLIYGKRAKSNMSWGVGLNYNYSFGQQFIFPIVAYSKVISSTWNMDALLPVSIKVRYKINDGNLLELSNRLTGDSYNIGFKDLGRNNLFLEKSDLLTELIYEREIHDFFWASASLGHRYNMRFNLSDENIFPARTAPLIKSKLTNAMFASVSLFLVPPRSWAKR